MIGADYSTVALAAIRAGKVVYTLPRPARHDAIVRLLIASGISLDVSEQGFTLTTGEFVTRKQAARVEFLAGQFLVPQESPPASLMTEDLW